jgi:hypothetical protein
MPLLSRAIPAGLRRATGASAQDSTVGPGIRKAQHAPSSLSCTTYVAGARVEPRAPVDA